LSAIKLDRVKELMEVNRHLHLDIKLLKDRVDHLEMQCKAQEDWIQAKVRAQLG